MKIISYSWILVLAIYLLILYKSKRKNIILLIVATIVTYFVNVGLKVLVMRERPEEGTLGGEGYSFVAYILNLISSFIVGQKINFWNFGDKFGFPSNHASIAFSAVALMNREFPNFKWIFILIASLIALSRVFLGVHYLSDVLAGALLGYVIGWGVLDWKKVFVKLKNLR